VIVLAAISTWLLPAGEYAKLQKDGQSFLVAKSSGASSLPLTQKTLDSLNIRINVQKFINDKIRKPVSIPGTFERQKRNQQGIIEILQAPIKGIYDSIDIILF